MAKNNQIICTATLIPYCDLHFKTSTLMITAPLKRNIDFESGYYPNKNHGITGVPDNTTFHLWNKMTNWVLINLGNDNTVEPAAKAAAPKPF